MSVRGMLLHARGAAVDFFSSLLQCSAYRLLCFKLVVLILVHFCCYLIRFYRTWFIFGVTCMGVIVGGGSLLIFVVIRMVLSNLPYFRNYLEEFYNLLVSCWCVAGGLLGLPGGLPGGCRVSARLLVG